MSESIERCLAAMFEADPDAPDYYERFPGYHRDSEVGAKPWWPPLSEVWAMQGEPPGYLSEDQRKHWNDAWALLCDLHSRYREARGE